jgi:hypothetical protein
MPGGLMSVLQLLEVSVNKAFKGNTGKLYTQWMTEGGHEIMPTGKMRPSSEMMCDWVARAWDMDSPVVNMNSFLKTGISNALDGSEDDMLWIEGADVDDEKRVVNLSQGDTSNDNSDD